MKIALIIRTTTKRVWLDLTGRAMQPAYVGTTTNHQIALNAPKNPFFTHKIRTYQIFFLSPENLSITPVT